MADPLVQYLPALSTALGNGPITPPPVVAGNALQRALVAGAAPVPALNGAQLQAQFNATPAVTPPTAAALPAAPAVAPTPAALTPAATPQPTAPVATPGANPTPNANVVNPPLPPGGLNADGTPANPSAASAVATGAVGLPGGGAAPAPSAPTPIRATLPTFNNVAGNVAADDNNPEVIRGGQIVPGTGAGAQGGFGSVGPYRDPSGVISQGFQNQQAYAQNFMNQALNYIQGGGDIFERATRGRAIAGILHAVAGQNNEGSVQGAGVDALNQSIAGVTGAGIGAEAQEYGADQTRGAREDEIAEQHYQAATTPVIAGAVTNPVNPYLPPIPYYQNRPAVIGGKAMPTGPNATSAGALPAALKVGAPYKGADGTYNAGSKTVTVKNGQVTSIQ